MLVGEALCDATQRRVELSAKGSTVAEQGRWSTSRLAPGRVSLEIGGLGPRRLQHSIEVTLGQFDRGRILGGCPTSLDFAGRSKRLGSGFGDRPAVSVGDRNERIRWRDVVAEAAFAEGDMGTDRLGDTALDFGAGCGRPGSARFTGVPYRSHASRIGCHPVHRHMWARRASAALDRSSGATSLARSPSNRQTMPGCRSRTDCRRCQRARHPTHSGHRGPKPLHGRHRTASHPTDRGH